MTTSFQVSNSAGDYPPNNFGVNYYSHPWQHDCTGNGCLECAKMYGNAQITYVPGNTYIPNQGWNYHICQGNPCTICGNGWNTYPYPNTTTTTNWTMCPKCNVMYVMGCYHACNDLDLQALKAKVALLEEEAAKMAKTLQRYKDLLEEFKLAIEAEQE